jgi:hypothetical protein
VILKSPNVTKLAQHATSANGSVATEQILAARRSA